MSFLYVLMLRGGFQPKQQQQQKKFYLLPPILSVGPVIAHWFTLFLNSYLIPLPNTVLLLFPHGIFGFKCFSWKKKKSIQNTIIQQKHKIMGEVKGTYKNQNKITLTSSFSHNISKSFLVNPWKFFLQSERLIKVQTTKSSCKHYSTNTWLERHDLV